MKHYYTLHVLLGSLKAKYKTTSEILIHSTKLYLIVPWFALHSCLIYVSYKAKGEGVRKHKFDNLGCYRTMMFYIYYDLNRGWRAIKLQQ